MGKKLSKSEQQVWDLDIFDDLEPYSVDMPPETFSPGINNLIQIYR